MRRIALAFAALLVAGAAAFAAAPAKTMDTAAGKVWTDEKGMTLYTFDKDGKGKSNCYDQCAKAWPPYAAAADAKADGDWTIVDRTDDQPGTGSATYCSAVSFRQASRTRALAQRL